MKLNLSKTWNGLAFCVRKTNGQYVVINYKKLSNNQSKLIIYKSDNLGVVIDFKNPLLKKTFSDYNEKYLDDTIKQYIGEKIKKPKKSKTTKKVSEPKQIISLPMKKDLIKSLKDINKEY